LHEDVHVIPPRLLEAQACVEVICSIREQNLKSYGHAGTKSFLNLLPKQRRTYPLSLHVRVNLNLVNEDMIGGNSSAKKPYTHPLTLDNPALPYHPTISEESVLQPFVPHAELSLDNISVAGMVQRTAEFTVTLDSWAKHHHEP
jgi:hypothetical protein